VERGSLTSVSSPDDPTTTVTREGLIINALLLLIGTSLLVPFTLLFLLAWRRSKAPLPDPQEETDVSASRYESDVGYDFVRLPGKWMGTTLRDSTNCFERRVYPYISSRRSIWDKCKSFRFL
jgi:hypothetical protein